MYIIEILRKIFNNKNLLNFKFGKAKNANISDNEENTCEHMFVPIDSTNKVFACYNCGMVINKKPKNLNFFKGEK